MLLVVATTVLAQGEFYSQPGQRAAQNNADQYHSQQFGNRNVNPWELPQPLVGVPDGSSAEFQPSPTNYGRQPAANFDARRQRPGRVQRQTRQGKFVTPEFLESLKQQQKQYQKMPDSQPYQQNSSQYRPLPSSSGLPLTGFPGQGAAYPGYGMGSANPLFDAPAVSPWGDGADVLYRGESFPLIPDEAIGGIAPMPMSGFGFNNSENDTFSQPPITDENNVFNPFTFLPNSGLRGQ